MEDTRQLIANYECDTGENPLWHAAEGRLYWCDIPKGHIFRHDPQTGYRERCYEGDVVGGSTIERDGAILCFMERGAIKRRHGRQFTTIIDSIPGEEVRASMT